MKIKIFYCILLATMLTACVGIKKTFKKKEIPIASSVLLNEISIKPQKNTNTIQLPSSKWVDIIHADIDVQFNWDKHECYGFETILLKPFYYDIDTIVLDAKNMIVADVSIKNKQGETLVSNYLYDNKKLKIFTDRKFTRKDTLYVAVKYTAQPDHNENIKAKAITDDKGLYFINTEKKEPYKPTQLWTQGETQSNSCWFPTIDNPNEKFTSSLTITTDKKYTILSNGEKVFSNINGNEKKEKWVNMYPMSAYLIMMAIGEFEIVADTSTKHEVSYFLENEYSPFAKNIFKHTPEMITFYSEKLGVEYPWNKYAQVVVRDYVSGAMENTSATLHGDFVQKNNRQLLEKNNEDIVSHELFHQWFGDLVTCKTWSHLVVNEGFATYGEQLWDEYKYGNEKALEKSYDRILRYINFSKQKDEQAIVNSNFETPDDMFTVVTYQKGAAVIHLLRNTIGDDAFFATLKNYLTKYAFQNADIDDLRREFEYVVGHDLQPFFNQWFLKAGHPILNIKYAYNDSLHIVDLFIEQTQKNEIGLYNFPLTIKIKQGNKEKVVKIPIAKKQEVFTISRIDTLQNILPTISIDPFATFVGEIIEVKDTLQYIKDYNEATNYVEKMRAIKSLEKFQIRNDSARATLLSAINDANESIRLKALQIVDWKNAQSYLKAKDMLLYLAEKDENANIRSIAIEILGEKRDPYLLNFFYNASYDSSYSVAGNALASVEKLLPIEALRLAKTIEKNAKGKLFEVISSVYAKHGDTSHIDFFESNVMKLFGRNRTQLLSNYMQLIKRINSSDKRNSAIEIVQKRAIQDEDKYVRYIAINEMNELHNFLSIYQKQITDTNELASLQQECNVLKESMNAIIQNENDSYVLGLLKLKGLHNGTKE